MKHNIFKALAAATLVATATTASAQVALRSGYFVEGYSYRHQLNPALAPDRGYVSIPLLSGINVSMQGNVGISNFLYEKPGTNDLMLFTNKAVKSSDFLDGLKDNNRIGVGINMTVFSFGTHKWGGFNTLDINLRSNTMANLPKGLFEFVKDLNSNRTYNFSDMGVSSTEYAEIAIGHSRRINEEWRAGAKVKILLGIADMESRIENMTATLNDEKWALEGHGYANVALKGLQTKLINDRQIDDIDLNEDSLGLAGAGFAIDLGATYRPHWAEGLEISAAINDLGFIKWKNNVRGVLDGSWECNGLNVSEDDKDNKPGGYNSFDTEIDNLGDNLKDAFRFRRDDSQDSRARALAATLNIAASYKLPWYDKLKVGFLSSTHINGVYSWSEGRFSANVSPVKCVDVTVDYAASTFGHSFGWLLNVHTRGIALFMGSDHMLFKRTPQGIPAGKLNTSLQFGINFPLGKQHSSDKL